MSAHLHIGVATSLARCVRAFPADGRGPAQGYRFERALFDAVMEVAPWRHAAGPDQFGMGLPTVSKSGVQYEFDGAFATDDTMYLVEAKHLTGGAVTREHIGVSVQRLLDTLMGSFNEIGYQAIYPVLVSATPRVDDAALRHAIAWGVLLIAPNRMTPFEMLSEIERLAFQSRASHELAERATELCAYLWRPFTALLQPATGEVNVFRFDANHIYGAEKTNQIIELWSECLGTARSIGLPNA